MHESKQQNRSSVQTLQSLPLIDRDIYSLFFFLNHGSAETLFNKHGLEKRSRTSKESSNYKLSGDTAAF